MHHSHHGVPHWTKQEPDHTFVALSRVYRIIVTTNGGGEFDPRRRLLSLAVERLAVHLLADLGMLREAAFRLLGVDQRIVVRDLEDPAAAGDEGDATGDIIRTVMKYMLRQTGGALVVSSGRAELNPHG